MHLAIEKGHEKYWKGTDFMCIFFLKKMNCYLVIMASILKWHFGIEWEVIYMTDAWNDPNLEEDLSCIPTNSAFD